MTNPNRDLPNNLNNNLNNNLLETYMDFITNTNTSLLLQGKLSLFSFH